MSLSGCRTDHRTESQSRAMNNEFHYHLKLCPHGSGIRVENRLRVVRTVPQIAPRQRTTGFRAEVSGFHSVNWGAQNTIVRLGGVVRYRSVCPDARDQRSDPSARARRAVRRMLEHHAGQGLWLRLNRTAAALVGEIGETVAWLCSDRASFVTGLPMQVDDGYMAQ
jgi:hypothetical protein